MPAKAQKLYRESHRDARLSRLHQRGLLANEVRPLALTIPKAKILTIKDSTQSDHERPII